MNAKKLIFERFYIIKSNWKSSSLFLVFILSCLLLPDPSLEQMKKMHYQFVFVTLLVTLLGLFLSAPNIL